MDLEQAGDEDDVADDEAEARMMEMMGFGGFATSKVNPLLYSGSSRLISL